MSQIDFTTEACRLISKQVKEYHRNLSVHYIIHRSGQRREALAVAAQDILNHPAAETALHMLQKIRRSEESAIIGTAVAHRKTYFGLGREDNVLSLCTLNLDQFEDPKDMRRYAWHLAWHAIDSLEYHAKSDSPADRNSDIIVRRRNALEIAGANLRADAFSAIISALQGDLGAILGLAIMRGKNALETRSLHNPEFYPYVMAKESTDFMVQELLRKQLHKKRFISSAMKTASTIGNMVDDNSLRQWLAFSGPAQDMAWRGYSPEEILAAAVNTSEDTSVRATGYMVSEVTGIESRATAGTGESYSPFADDAFNEKLHEKAVQAIFEDVITQGLRQRSADPFMTVANRQNESLTDGHILGWCASALQAAGKAYQRALDSGAEAESQVRQQFAGERAEASWDTLRTVGKKIVQQQRQGNMMTMNQLEKICDDDKAFASIRRAILTTMSDPSYQAKLDAVRELGQRPAGPEMAPAAAPSMAPAGPSAPGPRAAMPAPGMGMGGGGGRAVRTTPVRANPPPVANAEAGDQVSE